MKNIKNELGQTREKSYNRQLQIALLDSDLENLAAEINENLDYQKQLKQNCLNTKSRQNG